MKPNPQGAETQAPRPLIQQRQVMRAVAEVSSTAPSRSVTQFLSTKDVCKLCRFSRGTLHNKVTAGEFCQPVKLGRLSRFVASEVEAWMREQMEKRPGRDPPT